jgi:hypothetical protein
VRAPTRAEDTAERVADVAACRADEEAEPGAFDDVGGESVGSALGEDAGCCRAARNMVEDAHACDGIVHGPATDGAEHHVLHRADEEAMQHRATVSPERSERAGTVVEAPRRATVLCRDTAIGTDPTRVYDDACTLD